MPFDNFIARKPGDDAHPFYPLPGPTVDSFLVEDGDGQSTTAIVSAARSEVTNDGRRMQRTAWSEKLRAPLAITNTRLVFASTDFLRGFKKIKGHSYVGHVRHEWLAAVTASDLHFAKSPNQIRVTLQDPLELDWVNVLTFDLARSTSALSFAAELVRRATAFREHSNGEFTAPIENTTRNGGTRWLLSPSVAVDLVSSARAEPLA